MIPRMTCISGITELSCAAAVLRHSSLWKCKKSASKSRLEDHVIWLQNGKLFHPSARVCYESDVNQICLHSYYFLEDLTCVLEQAFNDATPGLLVERHVLSSRQLSDYSSKVVSFAPQVSIISPFLCVGILTACQTYLFTVLCLSF